MSFVLIALANGSGKATFERVCFGPGPFRKGHTKVTLAK